MSNLTHDILEKLTAKQVLVIYSSSNNHYIESHTITDKGMGAGVALSEDTLADLVSFFVDKQKDSYLKGVVPGNVLYSDWSAKRKVLIWFEKPQKRMMYFTKDLKIKSGEAMQPGLIFELNNGSLNVYAVASDSIKGDEQLFQAPYHNVNNHGDVCLGTAKMKRKVNEIYVDVINHYSGLFWNSEFSHAAGSVAPMNGNINTFWRNQIKTGLPFDYAVLKPIKKTIKSLLNAQNR